MPEHQWVDRRQAPVLPAAAQRVGRRTDRRARRDQLLIGPGLCPVWIGANRKVPIKSDRKPGLAPGLCYGRELAVGLPLQKFEELDALAMCCRKFRYLRRSRIAHRSRPFAPREQPFLLKVVLMQHFEHGKVGQRPSAALLKVSKGPSHCARRGPMGTGIERLETAKQRFQHWYLAS